MAENRIQAGISFEEKFFRNIYPEPNSGCWLWGGYQNGKGYGQIYVKGERKQAHRFSYEYHNNEILTVADFICHKCNMPPCCNPSHLYKGTQSMNMSQAYAEGRFGRNLYPQQRIAQYTLSGIFIKKFPSIMDAFRKTGISQPLISAHLKGKTKKAGGFLWVALSDIDEMELVNTNKESIYDK